MKRIIHPNESGGISVIVPYLPCGLTIEEIAAKDVPKGKPFLIVDTADVPSDRSQRQAWEADFLVIDGHGADYGAGSDWGLVVKRSDGLVLQNSKTGEVKIV